MSSFRDLEVWKKSRVLAGEIYRETRSFPRVEMFCLVQQMRRAALSVVCNIAEAHGRSSNRERMQFLRIGVGSLLELEAQTVIAGDLQYVTSEEGERSIAQIAEITRMLNGLIRHYEKRLT